MWHACPEEDKPQMYLHPPCCTQRWTNCNVLATIVICNCELELIYNPRCPQRFPKGMEEEDREAIWIGDSRHFCIASSLFSRLTVLRDLLLVHPHHHHCE